MTSSSGTGWACEVPKGDVQPRSSRGAHGRGMRAAVLAGSAVPWGCGAILLMSCPAPRLEPHPVSLLPPPSGLTRHRAPVQGATWLPSMLTWWFKHAI